MVKEYIERDETLRRMKIDVRPPFAVVRDMPAADVVEVKHGHWTIESGIHRYGLEDDVDEEFYLKCSECGREVWGIDYMAVQNGKDEEIFKEYPYCHCGAKMTKENKNG